MAYAFRAEAAASSKTVTIPSSVAAGDTLLLFVSWDQNFYSLTGPAGWTARGSAGPANGLAVFTKTAVTGDAGSAVSVTTTGGTGSDYVEMGVLAYSGSPPVASVTFNNSSSNTTSWAAPTVSGMSGGIEVIGWSALYNVSSGTTAPAVPAAMNSRVSLNGTNQAAIAIADLALTTTGTTAAQTATASQSDSWAAATVILGDTAPNAPTGLAPASGTVDRSVTQRLSWTFSDPDAGDSQSKFDLQWRHKGTTDAWNTVTQTTPNSYWDAPSSTFPAEDIEWQVRTYDQAGLAGPYSALAYFTAANPATPPTITAPVSGGTVSQNPTAVSWSASGQQGYQVRRVADNAGSPSTSVVYWDSGQVADPNARSLSVPFETNNRWEHVQVRIQQGGLWSTWSDVRVNVSYTTPAQASLVATAIKTVATPGNFTDSISIAITNPTPSGGQPTVSYNDIYMRKVGDTSTGIRIATGVVNNGSAIYYMPASNVAYQFLVRTFGANQTSTDSAWTS